MLRDLLRLSGERRAALRCHGLDRPGMYRAMFEALLSVHDLCRSGAFVRPLWAEISTFQTLLGLRVAP